MPRQTDQEYYFFRNSEFHAACATIFSRMNYNGQICCNIIVSYFKWHHNTNTGKSSLLSWKVFMWIMVKTCVLYMSHKIHLILKFIETDEASVNLLHNYSKLDCHKFENFNNLTQLYIWCFNPCYHNLPIRICSCTCICWLFQFACSAYCFLCKWRFAAFHLSRVGTVLC